MKVTHRIPKVFEMVLSSPELLAVSRRWYNAVVTRKESELKNFLSRRSELRFVGTADDELWLGNSVRDGIGKHFVEVPTVTKKEELLAEAFEDGQVGWSLFSHRFWFDNLSEPLVFRTTLIFVLEDGSWRIVHRHASLPTSNLETFGYEHTAIPELLRAAHDGFALNQKEGLVSIMFTDIVNSSPIVAAIGDRRWADIISKHFSHLKDTIEENGGQLVKSLGDGTMSSFPSAKAAMDAAILVQRKYSAQADEPRLSVRIGIHTGDVVRAGDDFFGTVVNKAARITAVSGAGEVCVSDVTQALIGDSSGLSFRNPKTVKLKGLKGNQRITYLDWH